MHAISNIISDEDSRQRNLHQPTLDMNLTGQPTELNN